MTTHESSAADKPEALDMEWMSTRPLRRTRGSRCVHIAWSCRVWQPSTNVRPECRPPFLVVTMKQQLALTERGGFTSLPHLRTTAAICKTNTANAQR